MLFNSYAFIFLFLPISWFGFQFLKHHHNQNVSIYWLVLASLFFYAYWKPAYLVLILASIAINYAIGQILGKLLNSPKNNKAVLSLGIIINLSALAYFKYANFFIDNVNNLIGSNMVLDQIILPLAISFFTFQQITYLVDTSKGLTSEHDFSHYCLYVTFFPQLIAGPIVHHKEMLPQFFGRRSRSTQYSDLAVGLSIFTIGLFKKVLIADNVAPYATDIFQHADNGLALSSSDAWIGALAYSFQLYFDFSGYADMAIGSSRLFGIRLPLNFNSPYQSKNIIDFWRRWHMTLSRFLRDYLYIPLGGNRKGESRRYLNLFLTMLLGGLWHGAGWTFIIWGALHGSYLIINNLWNKLTARLKLPTDSKLYVFSAQLLTFIAVVFAWVLFRAESLEGAMIIVKSMLGLSGSPQDLIKLSKAAPVLILLYFLVLLMPNTQELFRNYRPAFDFKKSKNPKKLFTWQPNKTWGIIVCFLLFICLLSLNKLSEFLYFQF